MARATASAAASGAAAPLLTTKLFVPRLRPGTVARPRLMQRLDDALVQYPLTLISAGAGFGKTTLVAQWHASAHGRVIPLGWLSLDEGDNDPSRFLSYLVAAVQTLVPHVAAAILRILQSPQPPPPEPVLTALLNELATIPDDFIVVLDDYHLIDATQVDCALTFLLEHLPPQMHLVIATREDPPLPLARYRARDQLTELRAVDLRFTPSEAAEFLNQVMGLNLSAEDIAALETRTEGWIAGLQLAAISMQGHADAASFIQSFTGSHHFVLDYLVEEVLQQQSAGVQAFLLRTSILDRFCGPLCDAVLLDTVVPGQATLEHLERANLFIVPLDHERYWYRYHHLFADLLRQRLQSTTISPMGDQGNLMAELHRRASVWYEENGLELEAFRHAVSANDIDRAACLAEGRGMPLHWRSAVGTVLNWLESLATTELNARPSLWVMYASASLFAGRNAGVEQKLQSAEAALQDSERDDSAQDILGRIATVRATMAVIQHDVDSIIVQSRRALAYLHPNSLPMRTAATWALGYASQLQGDRAAASQAYAEIIAIGKSFGDSIYTLAATISLGQVQETDNQLPLAARTYQHALQLAGDPPQPMACEAHLGLARILYQWNDLEAAEQHGQLCLQLALQIDRVDTLASYAVFLARLRLAWGDVDGAAAVLDQAEEFVRQHGFAHQTSDLAAMRVLILLHRGNLAAAGDLAEARKLPISQARVRLARGDPHTALALLEPVRQQAEARGWEDERLKVISLESVTFQSYGERDRAVEMLSDALALAEPGRFVRLFVDEGPPMAHLLSAATAHEIMPDYIGKLLAQFDAEKSPAPARNQVNRGTGKGRPPLPVAQPAQLLVEPLTQRELEVMGLLTQGLCNSEIGQRLYLALSTVKGHNRSIFDKLQVKNRTEAVARARELGLV